MPELPELQAHAERLTAAYAGVVLEHFEPLSFTALKTVSPAPAAAHGLPLERVARRGKHLLLGFVGDDTTVTFVVHLMQGGRLRDDVVQRPRPRQSVARWRFADHRAVLFTEAGTERRAGVWVVAGDPLEQPPLGDLGPEADAIDVETMTALLRRHSMRLHTFLRDQRILAGIGRRLANEVCHRAGLSPFAPTTGIATSSAFSLVAAIREAVADSLAEERDRDDLSPSRERPSRVHGRAGAACPVCGDTIRAVEYRDYTVSYCPTCQTGGKVLADNTTSKFLK